LGGTRELGLNKDFFFNTESFFWLFNGHFKSEQKEFGSQRFGAGFSGRQRFNLSKFEAPREVAQMAVCTAKLNTSKFAP